MANMYWPRMLQPNEKSVEIGSDLYDPSQPDTYYIVRKLFEFVQKSEDKQEIAYSCNLWYDEIISGKLLTKEFFRERPLYGVRMLDQERMFPYDKEREDLELFASLKVGKHIPGMTWSEFKKLTPAEADVVLDIARRNEKNEARSEAASLNKMEQLFSNVKQPM